MVFTVTGNTYYERALMLDAGPLISLYSPNDARKDSIRLYLTSLSNEKYPICITYPTIAEVHRRLLFDLGRLVSTQFVNDSLDGSLNIVNICQADHAQSRDIINRFTDQNISFTDASTMAVMKRLGIIKVLSYDFHFYLLNFEVINLQ